MRLRMREDLREYGAELRVRRVVRPQGEGPAGVQQAGEGAQSGRAVERRVAGVQDMAR